MAERSPQPNAGTLRDLRKFSPQFWLLAALTGVGAGIGGGLLMLLLQAVEHICWPFGSGDFEDAVARASAVHHIAIMLAAGALVGAGRAAFRYVTGGHGAELCAILWFRAGRMPFVPTVARAILSVTVVAMGAAVGREGALKQTGAAMASKLSEWAKIDSAHTRLLAACGAGAGMAAAYNVPFGGALFSLEVLLGVISLPLVLPALATSLIATAVSWIFLGRATAYQTPMYHFSLEQIAWAALAGPLIGLVAVGYIRLIGLADKRKPKRTGLLLGPILVFSLLGAAAISLPELLGNGRDATQRALTGEISSIGLLAVLALLRPLATAACLASGAPGGLFTPTMTTGAMLGAALGQIWGLVLPGSDPGTFALLGAAAMLSASTHGPISAVVLSMELTRRADPLMVPLLLACVLASIVSRRMESRSIYSVRVRQSEMEAVEEHVAKAAGSGASAAYGVLPASALYGRVLRRLLQLADGAKPLYVVDDRGRLVGRILPETARDSGLSGIPLDIATASDLATPTPSVSSAAPKEEAERLASAAPDPYVAIVDARSGRFAGALKTA